MPASAARTAASTPSGPADLRTRTHRYRASSSVAAQSCADAKEGRLAASSPDAIQRPWAIAHSASRSPLIATSHSRSSARSSKPALSAMSRTRTANPFKRGSSTSRANDASSDRAAQACSEVPNAKMAVDRLKVLKPGEAVGLRLNLLKSWPEPREHDLYHFAAALQSVALLCCPITSACRPKSVKCCSVVRLARSPAQSATENA